MKKQDIIALLKSGNFTVIYWDSGEATLYEKKWDKDVEFERDDYATMDKFKVDMGEGYNGYLPVIVELMAEALNGEADSI